MSKDIRSIGAIGVGLEGPGGRSSGGVSGCWSLLFVGINTAASTGLSVPLES